MFVVRVLSKIAKQLDKAFSLHDYYSITLPLILYIGLFLLIWTFHIPLKSDYTSRIHGKLSDVLKSQMSAHNKEHMDGVRIERDGDINKEYHKEIMFGDDEINTAEPEKLIEDIFHKYVFQIRRVHTVLSHK